jgi:hypothetical protein
VAAFLVAGLNVSNALATNVSHDENQKVTICHRTDSVTNPYVVETVDSSSVDGNTGNDHGQGDHLFEHTGPVFQAGFTHNSTWGDIIPPVDTNGHSYDGPPQTSLNWTEQGQAIYNNGCKLPGGQGGGEDQNVTLCHTTDGKTYTKTTVTASVAYNNHYLTDMSDIIPAFTFNGQNYTALNWTSTNQTIYNNNCVTGGTGGGDTTTTTPTATTTSSTTTTGGQGAETPAPTGGVSAGFGGGSQTVNTVSMIGLLGSLSAVGLGLRKLYN